MAWEDSDHLLSTLVTYTINFSFLEQKKKTNRGQIKDSFQIGWDLLHLELFITATFGW